MGGRIKTCWFNADDPLLRNYVYRADVSPDNAKVQITIHDRAELGRAGMSTYAIDFKQEGPSTVITTENRKMPPNLAAKMQYDIDRWKRGESNCNKRCRRSPPPPPPPALARCPQSLRWRSLRPFDQGAARPTSASAPPERRLDPRSR